MSAHCKAIGAIMIVLTLVVGCEGAAPRSTPTSIPPTPTATPSPTETPVPSGPTLAVPKGTAPVIDGTFSPDEWSTAYEAEFTDGSELLLMHDGEYLYLGIRARTGLPAASICVVRGDEIAVLHASASLATATYKPVEGGWQRKRSFVGCCSEYDNSRLAQEKRKRHLRKENWLASNGRMGTDEEMEFQIAMPEGSLRLAAAYLWGPDYDTAAWWPAALDDDCRNIDLLRGEAPKDLRFSPEKWVTVMAATTAGRD